MSRRKKRNREGNNDSGGGWITTFSDLMTLLLTFFILLYSFSTMDAIKFKNVASALQSVLLGEGKPTIFENDDAPGDMPIEEPLPIPNNNIDEDINGDIKRMLDVVNNYMKSNGLTADVQVREVSRGVVIEIKEHILFEPAEAELKDKSKEFLDYMTGLISQFSNEIVVEGHTDNLPISTKFYPSNWELSVARATTVVRYLVEEKGIDPTRISPAGYGEFRPIAPNDTVEHRRQNRRVSILIVTTKEGEINIDGDE